MTPLLALTGPTAVGKTALSLALAERLDAEILSVDSRQIYRGLDIATAKPTAAERARVPHHFVDERSLSDPITAGEFGRLAHARIREILDRGRVPLAVGGSTLYLTALVHGLADLPPIPEAVANAVAHELSQAGGARRLFDELATADPDAASTLDPTKSHRLARLVGVLRATGQPPSHAWQDTAPPEQNFVVVVLDRPRPTLYARIEARVDAMLEAGLMDENRALLASGVDPTSSPLQTIGYREPMAFLRGEIDEAEMVRLLKRNSRRYAKRQLTWFRRFPTYRWLDAETATPESILEAVRAGDPAEAGPTAAPPPTR